MPNADQPVDFWLAGIMLSLVAASFTTWFVLLERCKRGPILTYEPRRPVPWAGVWALLPMLFVAFAVAGNLVGDAAGEEKVPPPTEFAFRMMLGAMQQFVLVGVYFAVVVAVSGARRHDLGLPDSAAEFTRDVKIGFVAWLAALVPVYGMQMLLVLLFHEPSAHPLIEMLQKEASGPLFALAFAAAVIVAPICEETMFRLLLQGWLEKWEDRRVRLDESGSPDDWTIQAVTGSVEDSTEPLLTVGPARHGLAGLPHGWLPIILSSTLFALAHVGYGPDPIPLFVLALILGYTYQRTHRILPCIVTHALFNGMTLFALWRITTTVAAP